MFPLIESYQRVQENPNDTTLTMFVACIFILVMLTFLYAIFSICLLDKFKDRWYNRGTKRKGNQKMKKINKSDNKKTDEELQQYLAWRRKGGKVPAKKGKGSYDRKAFKKGE